MIESKRHPRFSWSLVNLSWWLFVDSSTVVSRKINSDQTGAPNYVWYPDKSSCETRRKMISAGRKSSCTDRSINWTSKLDQASKYKYQIIRTLPKIPGTGDSVDAMFKCHLICFHSTIIFDQVLVWVPHIAIKSVWWRRHTRNHCVAVLFDDLELEIVMCRAITRQSTNNEFAWYAERNRTILID